jgi:hypothetical protein
MKRKSSAMTLPAAFPKGISGAKKTTFCHTAEIANTRMNTDDLRCRGRVNGLGQS